MTKKKQKEPSTKERSRCPAYLFFVVLIGMPTKKIK
jgi:hypothetical protein